MAHSGAVYVSRVTAHTKKRFARYVFAIVFTDVSNEYANGFENVSEESLAFLQNYFFDLERSVFTLFSSICNGLNWGEIADKLNALSRVWGYLYTIFVAFCFLLSFCTVPSRSVGTSPKTTSQTNASMDRGLFAVLNVMTGMNRG